MLFPIIGVRFHGWLDDLVVLVYLAGAHAFGLRGEGIAVLVATLALTSAEPPRG